MRIYPHLKLVIFTAGIGCRDGRMVADLLGDVFVAWRIDFKGLSQEWIKWLLEAAFRACKL